MPNPEDHIVVAILNHAVTRPHSVCMKYEDRSITYGDLRDKVARWASAFRKAGIAEGDYVGIAVRDFIDDVVIRLAVISIGSIPGSLDVFSKPNERLQTLQRYGMSWSIEDDACFSGLPQSILVDTDWIALAEELPADLVYNASPNGAAQVIFTSGTSGIPVGAVQSHAAIFALNASLSPDMHGVSTRSLSVLWHSTAAGAYLSLLYLMEGGLVVFSPLMRDDKGLVQAIIEHDINFAFVPPNLIPGMLAIAKAAQTAPLFPKLGSLVTGSAASAPEMLVDACHWLTPGVVNYYGAGTVGLVARQTGEDLLRKPDSVGRIAKGVEVQIVDHNGVPLPAGTVGQLRMRGPATSSHLIGEARTNADRIEGEWNYPGDLAMVDDEGFLFLAGRQGDLINSGGNKIYPLEVETILARCHGVREIAVVGAPSKRDGQTVVAFAVVDTGISETDLETYCRQLLAMSKRPSRFILVSALPRNPSGKVAKRELLARLAGVPST